jgi:hypothetical protein
MWVEAKVEQSIPAQIIASTTTHVLENNLQSQALHRLEEPAIAFVFATASDQSTVPYGRGDRVVVRCDEGDHICLCWSR